MVLFHFFHFLFLFHSPSALISARSSSVLSLYLSRHLPLHTALQTPQLIAPTAYNRRISSSPLSSPSTVILTVTAPCTISASVETKTVTVAETLAIEQTQTVTRANSTATVTVTVAETLAVEQTQTITQPGVTQTKTIELVTLSTVVTKAVNGSVRRS